MKLGGFDLDFEVVEWGAMLLGYRSVPDAPTSKGVDVLNISLSYTDPSSMFRYWHSSSYSPTNQNWGHWSTPHPMACCSRRSKLSILRCATGYWQKRALVVDEAPWVWIARDLDRRAMSAKVKGFPSSAELVSGLHEHQHGLIQLQPRPSSNGVAAPAGLFDDVKATLDITGARQMTDAQPRLLIRNGTLIDGSGCDPVANTLVVVQGNRITHVGPADSSIRPESPDDTVLDATGKFILPGLIDAHCHISLHQGALPGVKYTSSAEFCTLWAAYAIGRVLRAGVTSIAVPGGK